MHSRWLGLTLLPFALAACSEPPPTSTVGGSTIKDAGNDDEEMDAGEDEEIECDDGPTTECTCDDGAEGIQYCNSQGAYSDCDCEIGGGSGDKCKAGYYTGAFKGRWRPGFGDLGSGATTIDVEIEAKGKNGAPGLALTLVEKVENAGGEFATYEVKDGCVYGAATSSGPDMHLFVGTLTGELNCDTGEFTGSLDGSYDLFDLGGLLVWPFSGPMIAQFNPQGGTLDEGSWRMKEKQAKPTDNPWAGGEGMWDATWTSKDSPALPAECQEFIDMGGGTGENVWDGGGPPLKN